MSELYRSLKGLITYLYVVILCCQLFSTWPCTEICINCKVRTQLYFVLEWYIGYTTTCFGLI